MKIKELFNQAIQFLKEVYFELRKVSWLSRKEMLASTLVVVILVILVGFFVGLIDFLLARILDIIL